MLFAPFFRKKGVFASRAPEWRYRCRSRDQPPVRARPHSEWGLGRRIYLAGGKHADLLSVPPRRTGSWQPNRDRKQQLGGRRDDAQHHCD